jgi:isoquinoline 1-oxidoreductase beta subunit
VSTRPTLTRGEFIKVAAVAGSGLVIGFVLPGCQTAPAPSPTSTSAVPPEPGGTEMPVPIAKEQPTPTPNPEASFEPNAFLKIDGTGVVTITTPRPEIGQGVRTALAMLVAEELDADWATVQVEQAPADTKYGNQQVGGSRTMFESYNLMRQAGAIARAMLLAAAAGVWNVGEESCRTESGRVIHQPSGQQLSYADLAEAAADLPIPRRIQPKNPAEFKIIGTSINRWDNPGIVTGEAIYGSDIQLPGMLYATVARPPVLGGAVDSYDDTQALVIPGVRQVLQISSGIAVVAENTWAAVQGRQALAITWDEGSNSDVSTENIRTELLAQFPDTEDGESENVLKAIYEIPHLAHATMEPMNCTADVRDDHCQVWAPTQNPNAALGRAVRVSGLPSDAVQVHIPLIGGGFGRRLQVDYVGEAVEISKAVGAPIKLQWTREDDIQNDYYHPFSIHLASANLANPSRPQVHSQEYTRLRTGAWRSVDNFTAAFVRESFIDEMAVALDRDPYEFRLDIEPKVLHPVLELAATQAGWGDPLPDGWGRGIAVWSTFNMTPTSLVVDVSIARDGKVNVHRVVCAVNCGVVTNPNMVKEQMEGGIVFGLTAALKEAITVKDGRVQQSNFHNYPLLRMDEMPQIEVHIVSSDAPPSGVGEMGVPPTAPAVANAIYNATGVRIRKLPIHPENLKAT